MSTGDQKRRSLEGETRRELEQHTESYRWIQTRADTIREVVTAHDVLRRNGVRLKQTTADREEQFSCPFHGRDNKPSARVYPETVRGPSHVWCFVCQERWDVIGLWGKFAGAELKFTRILGEMERAFGIIPPDRPAQKYDLDEEDPEMLEVDVLFVTCEKRLRENREAFEMKSHLLLGSVLDQLYLQIEEGKVSPGKAKGVLQKVLDKIGEKVRVT
jgi:hypothetical protein